MNNEKLAISKIWKDENAFQIILIEAMIKVESAEHKRWLASLSKAHQLLGDELELSLEDRQRLKQLATGKIK